MIARDEQARSRSLARAATAMVGVTLLAVLVSPAAAADAEAATCTTDVGADLVPTGLDSEVDDWVVGQVDVVTEATQACEGVSVAAHLVDADGEILASGLDRFVDGRASIEMAEGLAPVGQIVEVRIDLPLDPADEAPRPTVEEPDTPEVLDRASDRPVPQAAPSEEPPRVLASTSSPLARTGAATVMLVLLGLAGLGLGLSLLRFRDLVR